MESYSNTRVVQRNVPGMVGSVWESTEEVISPPSSGRRMPLDWKKVDMVCFYTWPDYYKK